MLAYVFPTPVGVFPISGRLVLKNTGLPHARGGVSKRAHLRRSRPGQESLIHPGIPAGPFLRPGLDENVEKELDVQEDHLGAAIDKAIR